MNQGNDYSHILDVGKHENRICEFANRCADGEDWLKSKIPFSAFVDESELV